MFVDITDFYTTLDKELLHIVINEAHAVDNRHFVGW